MKLEAIDALKRESYSLNNRKIWNKSQSDGGISYQGNPFIRIKDATTGITLVALVVTIVVLLILAGITLTFVLGDNSVFGKAAQAKEKTAIAKAREKLEIVLSEAQILKYSGQKYNQNEYLDEMILNKVPGSKVNGDIAISDGYAFTLDRNIPWIGEYIGQEKDFIFPNLETSVTISADRKKATLTINAKEEKDGIQKIEILQDGIVIKPFNYENEKGQITETYDITRNGKYVIKATSILTSTKIENITDLILSVEYSPNGNTTWKKEHQVKVTAKESMSTLKSIKYQWTDTTVEPAISTFSKTVENGGTIIENASKGKYYLWTLVEDNDGNTRIEKSEAFWFDNTVPTVEIIAEPVSETAFTLTTNATDEQSGIAKYEFYVGDKLENTQNIEEETASYTWNGTEMTKKECYVNVIDKAGNVAKKTIEARTLMHCWATYNATSIIHYKAARGSYVGTLMYSSLSTQKPVRWAVFRTDLQDGNGNYGVWSYGIEVTAGNIFSSASQYSKTYWDNSRGAMYFTSYRYDNKLDFVYVEAYQATREVDWTEHKKRRLY